MPATMSSGKTRKDQKSNIYWGGYEGDIYRPLAKDSFTDTRPFLGDAAKTAAEAIERGRTLKSESNVMLGEEEQDWETTAGSTLRDFSYSIKRDPQEEKAEEARRGDLREKHYILGSEPVEYKSLAAESFAYRTEQARAIATENHGRVKAMAVEAYKTSFDMGSDEVKWESEATAHMRDHTAAVERSQGNPRERLPPPAKASNIEIGLAEPEYETMNGAANKIVEKAVLGGETRAGRAEAAASAANGRASNFEIGEDEIDPEEHYTSATKVAFFSTAADRAPSPEVAAARRAAKMSAQKASEEEEEREWFKKTLVKMSGKEGGKKK